MKALFIIIGEPITLPARAYFLWDSAAKVSAPDIGRRHVSYLEFNALTLFSPQLKDQKYSNVLPSYGDFSTTDSPSTNTLPFLDWCKTLHKKKN